MAVGAKTHPATDSPDQSLDHPGRSDGKAGPGRTESGQVRAAANHRTTLAKQLTRPDLTGPSPGQSGRTGRTRPDRVRGGPERATHGTREQRELF